MKSKKHLINRGKLFLKYLASGGPGFVLGIALNIFLVHICHLWPPLAYIIVLSVLVFMNFFICKIFVFCSTDKCFRLMEFSQFATVIIFFRCLDWGIYTIMVQFIGVYYLYAQLINIAIFTGMKFFCVEKIMVKKK